MRTTELTAVTPLFIVATTIAQPNGFDVAVKCTPFVTIEVSDAIFDDANPSAPTVTVEIIDPEDDLIVTVNGEDANLLDLPEQAKAIVAHVNTHRAIYNVLFAAGVANPPIALRPALELPQLVAA